MSNEAPSPGLERLLTNPRFEVLPTAKILDAVRAHVPTGRTVTITASPVKPIESTIDLACTLAEEGYDALPHLAARQIAGPAHLGELCGRLTAAGVKRVFVPAGDAGEPAGEFTAALDLLRALRDLGDPFAEVCITGYPERHPTIDDDVTIQAMWDKRQYATHIISNMTFDVAGVGSWVERVRRRGVTLPIVVGVTGPVERTKLLGMATKIGVGESIRFLGKKKGIFARIAAPGYSPDGFVRRVGAMAADEALGIAGLHVFTFNQVEAAEAWRRRLLEEARGRG